jgi:hypothetical protein
MAKKKPVKSEKPRVNPELKDFDIRVNSFGEIITSYNVDKINEFLNRHVDDKKLRDREDLHLLKNSAEDADEEENESDEDRMDDIDSMLDEDSFDETKE